MNDGSERIKFNLAEKLCRQRRETDSKVSSKCQQCLWEDEQRIRKTGRNAAQVGCD